MSEPKKPKHEDWCVRGEEQPDGARPCWGCHVDAKAALLARTAEARGIEGRGL